MERRPYLAAVAAGTLALAGCTSRPALRGASSGRRGVELAIDRLAGDSPLEVTGTLVEDEVSVTSHARLRLAVVNRGEVDARYATGAPPPLGVLEAGTIALWTDAYAESDHVSASRLLRRVGGVEDVGLEVAVPAGERVEETYEFAAPPGEYRVRRNANPFSLDGVDYAIDLRVFEK